MATAVTVVVVVEIESVLVVTQISSAIEVTILVVIIVERSMTGMVQIDGTIHQVNQHTSRESMESMS